MADKPLSKISVEAKLQLFVDEYLDNGFNGAQAAIAAGYSKKDAHVTASTLLRKHEGVKKRIEEGIKEILEISSKKKARWVKEIEKIAYNRSGLIKDGRRRNGGIQVKATDKTKALEIEGKYMQMFAEMLKIEHEGNVNINLNMEGKVRKITSPGDDKEP